MWYAYQGFDKQGTLKKGTLEGVDEEDVRLHLRSKGIFGIRLIKVKNQTDEVEIINVDMAKKETISTGSHEDTINVRFNFENLRKMLRSILLDVGVTEEVLRDLIIDLKSDDILKQKKVIVFIEDMGYKKEALVLSKAFLFRTDFQNTQNPQDQSDSDSLKSK